MSKTVENIDPIDSAMDDLLSSIVEYSIAINREGIIEFFEWLKDKGASIALPGRKGVDHLVDEWIEQMRKDETPQEF